MWDNMAYKLMGGVQYTDLLIRANRKYCDLFVFPAGIELTVPDVAEPVYDKLPPWKVVPG